MSFGISSSYYTSSKDCHFQRGVQGNGTAPPMYLIILILLNKYSYSTKFVSILKMAISQIVFQLIGFLHVDDTNLILVNNS